MPMPRDHILTINSRGWVESARMIPSDNFNARPDGVSPSLLVVHNISLPPGQFGGGFVEQFFQNRLDGNEHPFFAEIADLQVSAHFFIDRQGALVQFVSVFDRAWHAGVSRFCGRDNCNDYSIGVELEGADHIPYTEEQYDQLALLTKSLMIAFPAIAGERIVGHSDIAPGRKTDPGEAFDWACFRAKLI